jgi:20S proteasome subunit alpha 5
VALLLAGYDDKGPQLFFSDPSGTFTQYKAKAIGRLIYRRIQIR